MKLIIFDLDQTLVDFSAVHDDTTHELFRDVFGVNARLTEIDFTGKSLTDNLVELARLKGIAEASIASQKKDLLTKYESIFQQKISIDLSGGVLPGVRTLLRKLIKAGYFIELYTGDSRGIVEIVMSSTGLDKYFQYMAYGTESESRLKMARLAISQAEKITGCKFRDKDIVIIGDSTRDVECGQQLGALTVAVATGFHSPDELKARKPDYIFLDLTDTVAILKAIGQV